MASPQGPAPPNGPAGGHWVAHLSPDGRPFWNHSITKQSVWEKPSELKGPIEKEMENTPWKEYETGGRKYWVSSETKETTWEMPQVLRDILARAAAPGFGSPSQPHQPPFNPQLGPSGQPLTPMSGALVGPGGFVSSGGVPVRMQPLPQLQQQSPQPVTLPDFQSHADAERAFMNMLGTIGVTPTWTWEQTMRETITEPYYKALKTLAERKTAFEKFVAERKQADKDERERSLERCRKDFFKALDRLGGGPEKEDGVKSWWGWEKGERELSRRMGDAWKAPRNDEEKRTLFEEYIDALRTKESTKRKELRLKNMDKVAGILQALSLDIAGSVRWREAQSTIYSTPEWANDHELQRLEPIDLLAVFEDELHKAEKEARDAKQRTVEEKRRRGRKSREDFVTLLETLRSEGHIVAGTTWKAIYPLVEADERFHNLLGNPGSSPLDLFWDVVDRLDQQAEDDERRVAQVLHDKKVRVSEQTTYDEFVRLLDADERLAELDHAIIKAVYVKLHGREIKLAKEEKRKAEKKLRLLIDDLRYAYKKLDPPVDLDSTYDENLPLIEEQPEFLALIEDEPSRRLAFEKFIKRQKEKAKEREIAEAEAAEKRKDKDSARSSSHRDRDARDARDSRHRDADHEPRHRESEHRSSRRDRRGSRGAREDSAPPDEDDGRTKRGASDEGDSAGLPPRKAPRVDKRASERPDVEMRSPQTDVEEGEI
ncbi:hypothetical protein RQP46_001111 [Phenoliferia psychrophenolica]